MKIDSYTKLNKYFQLLYKNLNTISGSSNFVLEELKNFRLPDKDIYDAFNALRSTVLFDLEKEVRTLDDKMGLHPSEEPFDEHAKGDPLVNMEFIRNWLTKDILQMQNAIQNLQDQIKKGSNIPVAVNVLCMEQGVHILKAFTHVLDILDDFEEIEK